MSDPVTLSDVLDALNVFNKPRPSEGCEPWTEADFISVKHLPDFINTIAAAWFSCAQPAPAAMQPLPDHDNHHNALKCPYCNPRGLAFAEPAAQPAEAQQNPVAWRHSKTGRLSDLEEEVSLADGDEWAEPLYAAPVSQQEPSAWRQWSTKRHDWDYQTNRGDLRPDAPADPLFVAAAQPAQRLTDERVAFERWHSEFRTQDLIRRDDTYYNAHARFRWEGWQARAIESAIAARLTATPAAGRDET